MIYDQLTRIDLYRPLTRNLGRAIDYVSSTRLEKLEPGRHEVDGERVFATLYETKTMVGGARWESHRRYIDLQIMLKGQEHQAVADTSGLSPAIPYDPERDVIFYAPPAQSIIADLREGQFVVYFPHDGHLPMIAVGMPGPIRKLVVKVLVE